MWFLLFLIVAGSLPLLYLLGQYRGTAFYQHLSALRLNAADYLRFQVREYANLLVKVEDEMDGAIHGVRLLQQQHKLELDRNNLVQINEDLVQELAKLLQENATLESRLGKMLQETEKIGELTVENIELRVRNGELENDNKKLVARNEELEYAINLESISMLEGYQQQNKLFTAIDDVRRSLSRILNPV